MTLKKNIGYIGLGNIGGPTAKHIINDEFNLYVYDLNEDAVKTLRKIFPAGKIKKSNFGLDESSNYVSEINIDYSKEEKNIFRQLEALYECARRVSTGISHFIGAVG